jgi:cysteine synthase/rhodanese-related sulfurtransferase
MSEDNVDNALLEKFEKEVLSQVPHIEEKDGKVEIVNATPLLDLSDDLKECAKKVYDVDISEKDFKVYGKFDGTLLTGSIKLRPAINIIHDAIATGKIKTGTTVIEATSGNFGIALGLLSKIGVTAIALVSRKLQEGVFKELRNGNIRIMDLDMDICPAPGMEDKQDALVAKATAANVRSQLIELGFEPETYDSNIEDIETLLAKKDIINLAKFLAKIYNCFCPAQYDNDLNVEAHRTVTGVEIDQQLHENDESLQDYSIVCTFGTGGTSGGLSKYFDEQYNKKGVHVIFPPDQQDVAGIRTVGNADGLKYYNPDKYAGKHQIDFEQAKPLLKFMVEKGHDMGESSALELYAALQMIYNNGGKFVVMICDGIDKYRKNFEKIGNTVTPAQVSQEEVASKASEYDKVIWVHTQYTPREEGIEILAKSLGIDKSKIVVPNARTAQQLLSGQQVPEEIDQVLQESKGKSLMVCMAGRTSLMAANVLAEKGIQTDSLTGGITGLAETKTKDLSQIIEQVSQF